MEFNDLEVIDINNRDRNLTNPEIDVSIKELFNCDIPYFNKYGEELDNATRFLMICRDSSYITDAGFSNRVIELIKRHLNSEALNKTFLYFMNIINEKNFSVDELIKIKAITFSLFSYYELKTKINTPPNITPPQLNVDIDDENKLIYHNLSFVENIVDRNFFIAFSKHQETLSFEEAIINYDDAIKSNRYFGYKRDTDVSAKTIRLLQEEKKELIKRNKAKTKVPQQTTPDSKKENIFSALEWATIFYYADETKLLPDSKFSTTRREDFIKKHNIETTPDNFKNEYYNAKKRINIENNFPIEKLDLIIPFLKTNYSKAVDKVENDIIFLQNELLD